MTQRCFYKLKIGTMWLAPRNSIAIRESRDFERIAGQDSGKCGSACSLNVEREFTFEIDFFGGGSLASAWALSNRLLSQLTAACTQEVDVYRQVCDETAIQYRVKRGSLRMTDTLPQFLCERILRQELKLTLVNSGPQVSPIILPVTIPPVVVNLSDIYFV